MDRAAEYGIADSVVVWHNWQRWGYDYRLPDLYPPNPGFGTFDDFRALTAACNRQGTFFAPHDNYIDFYPDATGFTYDSIVFNQNGTPQRAWFHHYRGAQSYRSRPDQLMSYVQRNVGLEKDGFGPTAYFIDVWSSMAPYDYWTNEGKFVDRGVAQKSWGGIFAWIREALGNDAPQISEAGHDKLIGWLDGAQAQQLRIDPKARDFTWKINCADSERIPWIDVAWHDKFILHGAGYPDRYAGGLGEAQHGAYSDDYITTEVLSGRPAMVPQPFNRDVIRVYWLLNDAMRALALDRVDDVEFVGNDIRGRLRALRLSLCMQGRQRITGERKCRHDVTDRPEFADGPVDQASRRPTAEHVGDDGAVVASGPQRRPVRRQYFRLRAEQKRRSDLDCCGTKRQRRCHGTCVCDAAGRNHRHLDRVDHLREQRKQSDLGGRIRAQKHSAVSAGLEPLRDDGVATVRFQTSRLFDRRRGADDFTSRSLDPRKQFFFRQAIVEAHNRGLDLFDDRARRCVERPAGGARDGRGRINAELDIVRFELFTPCVLTRIAWHRHLVREKIKIERLVFGRSTELFDLCADLLAAQQAGRQGPKPARLCDRNRELDVRCSRHWRLEDGDVDREEIQKRSVRPHWLAPAVTGRHVSAFNPAYEFATV